MNPLAEEWVRKAEGDFRTAGRELRAEEEPNHDAACFHAQQCVEKYLKALLEESGIGFPKTHDLGRLTALLEDTHPQLTEYRDAIQALTNMGVEVRYPGVFADEEDAEEAVATATTVRGVIRDMLDLS